ncbi:MAG: putative Ig domain-containing protein [Candidatus Omnitrophica bacterium]|nr:putative Ig domain-containing protein [Candidatus Omnitrophota bacterium]
MMSVHEVWKPRHSWARVCGILGLLCISSAVLAGNSAAATETAWDRMQLGYTQPPTRVGESLLDYTEALAARYFWEQALAGNGFVRDLTNAPQASIAATGFGLATLAVLAERSGSNLEWTVTESQARARVQQILDAAVQAQQQQASDPARYGKAGLLYHFVDGTGARVGASEVSTVDMALLLAGALSAGQYFGGTVQARANALFNGVDWSYFFDAATKRFYHAWKPELTSGFDVVPRDQQGYLSRQEWDRPTDEVLLINLLALARTPTNLGFRGSLYAWPRVARSYAGYNVVNSYFGSLFTYLFGHIFFDFKAMGVDDPASAQSTVQPVDWFNNARDAALANRQFVRDQAGQFLTYSEKQWGLSACYRPNGSYFGENGTKPAEANNGEPLHDGTVPPYGAISAMPLVRNSSSELLNNNLAFQALLNYYNTHYSGLWGPYGPRDSLKTQLQGGQPVTAYSPLYVGIDVGPEALMIENYRTGLPQRYFMSHPSIRTAVLAQFPVMRHQPVLNLIRKKAAIVERLLSFTVSASDPDGDALTYAASPLPSGASFNPSTRMFTWTPNSTQGGPAPNGKDYHVTFTVTDGSGLSNAETVTITVLDACFLATAAYGTPLAAEVQTLREFRDQVLLTYPASQGFVQWYYRTSPPLARFISDKPLLRFLVRAALRPMVGGVQWWMTAHGGRVGDVSVSQ